MVVFFYADELAACLLTGLTRRAAAHGEIQNGVACAAVSLNQVGQQGGRLLGGVQRWHVFWVSENIRLVAFAFGQIEHTRVTLFKIGFVLLMLALYFSIWQ